MKRLLLCMWTLVLLVLMGSGSSMGCSEEERNALLNIKAAFNPPNGSSLSFWRDGNGNCCSWTGVKCDNTTWRVTQLDLANTRDAVLPEPWVIDASLFLPLEELQELYLSYNSLSGLNGMLPLKLKRLDLSFNHLERVPSLYKQTLSEAQNVSSFQLEAVNLEVLDLSNNNLVDGDITDITRIESLKALDISDCGLNSSKLQEGLCRLRNLEELDISHNGFWGPLPSCLSNMTSLRALDVQDNNFIGAIPSSLLYNLKSLEYIVFSGNAFEGSLSLASLANNSNIEVFRLVDNRKRLEVNTEESTWFPSFQLKKFGLSNCVLNKNANSVIPSFLKVQYDLRSVQLSHNEITGNFPNWLLKNNVNLEEFELQGNNLSGEFHLPSNLNLVRMWWFDLSANIIEGELPSWIGSNLPGLVYLNLSNNLLEGRIPPSMSNMARLEILDLSNNFFIGEIPEMLAQGCTSLFTLKLSSNNLQGQMLPRYSNLTGLNFLYLDSNHFTGDISPSILNTSLLILDASDNFLSGTLPNWIGDIQYLQGLMLSSNLLGALPLSFCNLYKLDRLDISNNNLGPIIPPCANFTFMTRFLHLTNDTLSGHFPEFLSRALSLVTLDLRYNALSGEIPNWIGSLRNLKVLLLRGNNFEGSIPLDLCLLKNMSLLDLSNNNLSGNIPSCLKYLTFGNYGVFKSTVSILRIWTVHSHLMAENVIYPFEESFMQSSRDWTVPWESWESYDYKINYPLMSRQSEYNTSTYMDALEEVNFTTKRRFESYRGNILKLMSGMDLSWNNLTGLIPLEVGYLSELLALNLSHNHLLGPIPETFSNLKNVESLDLSYNNLTGHIPPQLTELYALSDFSVAHNNLSGRTPDQKNQFGTFGEASYVSNPFLCGPPLTSWDCSNQKGENLPSFNHTREDDSWREAFLWSFAGSYTVAFLGVVLFLYLNSYYMYVLLELVRQLIPSFP